MGFTSRMSVSSAKSSARRFVLECIRIYVARCKEMDGKILMINTHRQQSCCRAGRRVPVLTYTATAIRL